MSQLLEAFGINWKLLAAQAVNFAIVLVALTYFLYKPVMTTLEKRRAVVAQGVEDAKEAGAKLARADGEAAALVQKADAEANHIVSSARESASEEKLRLITDAEARAEALTKDAEARASEIAARAARESEKDVARLAILAAEKILKKKYD